MNSNGNRVANGAGVPKWPLSSWHRFCVFSIEHMQVVAPATSAFPRLCGLVLLHLTSSQRSVHMKSNNTFVLENNVDMLSWAKLRNTPNTPSFRLFSSSWASNLQITTTDVAHLGNDAPGNFKHFVLMARLTWISFSCVFHCELSACPQNMQTSSCVVDPSTLE